MAYEIQKIRNLNTVKDIYDDIYMNILGVLYDLFEEKSHTTQPFEKWTSKKLTDEEIKIHFKNIKGILDNGEEVIVRNTKEIICQT